MRARWAVRVTGVAGGYRGIESDLESFVNAILVLKYTVGEECSEGRSEKILALRVLKALRGRRGVGDAIEDPSISALKKEEEGRRELSFQRREERRALNRGESSEMPF
ncbi:hypothetical protein CDL15_Pgr026727 [Punica granatum]|uniref:Uncharacterized protein n=1 Tax=Punica granatum TaxID=22663 RepID=A0A218WMB0_PUNGR|nr:hypothetical protein CDL15_Pgr026727 [Punica granatum]